jgi:hypothetical protein
MNCPVFPSVGNRIKDLVRDHLTQDIKRKEDPSINSNCSIIPLPPSLCLIAKCASIFNSRFQFPNHFQNLYNKQFEMGRKFTALNGPTQQTTLNISKTLWSTPSLWTTI